MASGGVLEQIGGAERNCVPLGKAGVVSCRDEIEICRSNAGM